MKVLLAVLLALALAEDSDSLYNQDEDVDTISVEKRDSAWAAAVAGAKDAVEARQVEAVEERQYGYIMKAKQTAQVESRQVAGEKDLAQDKCEMVDDFLRSRCRDLVKPSGKCTVGQQRALCNKVMDQFLFVCTKGITLNDGKIQCLTGFSTHDEKIVAMEMAKTIAQYRYAYSRRCLVKIMKLFFKCSTECIEKGACIKGQWSYWSKLAEEAEDVLEEHQDEEKRENEEASYFEQFFKERKLQKLIE